MIKDLLIKYKLFILATLFLIIVLYLKKTEDSENFETDPDKEIKTDINNQMSKDQLYKYCGELKEKGNNMMNNIKNIEREFKIYCKKS